MKKYLLSLAVLVMLATPAHALTVTCTNCSTNLVQMLDRITNVEQLTNAILAALCLPALALVLLPEQAWAADEDFVSTLIHDFYNKTSTWEPTLKRYALVVFRWLLILEVCFLGIKAALNHDQIQDIFKQFIMLILMAGFFMAVINYYQEWAWNLINGLGSIG